jgi:uncharacterized protein DUF4258
VLADPLEPGAAKQCIHKILATGGASVSFSAHALEELENDKLTTIDAINVLRGGVVEAPELERGTWRYRVRTNRIVVVVAFRSETHLRVVTAWRI